MMGELGFSIGLTIQNGIWDDLVQKLGDVKKTQWDLWDFHA